MTVPATAVLLLAVKEQPGQAGPLGLFIIILMAVATVLLIRSMGKHLRRIPPTFDPPDEPPSDTDHATAPTDGPHQSS